MALISDILAEVLGEEPTEIAVWRATKQIGSAERVAKSVVREYLSTDLDPLPAKSKTALRPAFLSDYQGRSDTPYDREFTFVGKSLCYSDEVAVPDEINDLIESNDIERAIAVRALGFPECSDLRWVFRRIARYAELERSGLLHFVPRPPRQDAADIPGNLLDEAVRDLGPMVVERHGWDTSVVDSMGGGVLREELASWLAEFNAIFEYAALHTSLFDIYLPEWFAGPELLNWVFRSGTQTGHLSDEALQQQRALTQLVSLPSPSVHSLRRSALQDLPRIRESRQLSSWREQLRDALRDLDADPTLLGTRQFEEHLKSSAASLKSEVDRSHLSNSLSGTIETGIATAPTAYLFGQDVLGAAATAVAPLLMRLVSTWLSGTRTIPEEKVEDSKRSGAAFRAFLSEPWSPSSSNQAPPTTWIRTIDGRPVAFDLFDNTKERDD